MRPIELLDRRFGRLVVVARVENDQFGKARWRCRCDCGGETTTRANTLLKGETQSCGCLHLESVRRARSHGQARQGDQRNPLYRVWCSAKARCHAATDKGYPNYGGRGIVMCNRWREDFALFLADMGPRPPGYTLGRIDNDGPYSPENCRWETYQQQGRNTRRNFLISYQGETLTIGEWATRVGLDEGMLYYRIRTARWPIKRALTTPSTPPVGEDHPGHKLSDADVAQIRAEVATGRSQGSLARQYRVAQSHISRIIRQKARH